MLVGRAPGVVVLLAPGGAVAGVDVRGAPVGTRELDLLDPTTLVRHVHAVVLCGGGRRGREVVGWRRAGGVPGGCRRPSGADRARRRRLGLVAGTARCLRAAREELPAAVALVGDTAVGWWWSRQT
ncbi:hypothetical protein K7G98_19645 [Saccharothrix sp. MB29]|nr:hypothetical protein [Saccharothrix sp. MB29]